MPVHLLGLVLVACLALTATAVQTSDGTRNLARQLLSESTKWATPASNPRTIDNKNKGKHKKPKEPRHPLVLAHTIIPEPPERVTVVTAVPPSASPTKETEETTVKAEAVGPEVQKPQTKPTKIPYGPAKGTRRHGSHHHKSRFYGGYSKYYRTKAGTAAGEHEAGVEPGIYYYYRAGRYYFHSSMQEKYGYPSYSPSSLAEHDEPASDKKLGDYGHPPEDGEGREGDVSFVV